MAAVGAAKTVQPTGDYGRPEKENFHGDNEEKGQVGYSKQC
jgi:hypothetical protein